MLDLAKVLTWWKSELVSRITMPSKVTYFGRQTGCRLVTPYAWDFYTPFKEMKALRMVWIAAVNKIPNCKIHSWQANL